MRSPLEGIRVIDMTHAMAGPLCTQTLGDFGADVIKIERPGSGDMTRQIDTRFNGGISLNFSSLNRNKRSLAVDMKTPDGRDLVRKLLLSSDVVIENMRPGVVDRLGLGYGTIAAENPGVVYAHISGYGEDCSWVDRPGQDLLLQAVGGLMALNAQGSDPRPVGTFMCDAIAGYVAAIGIMMALRTRDHSGKGQEVRVSMFDAQLSAQGWEAAHMLNDGDRPQSLPGAHSLLSPYGVFRTSDDRYIAVGGSGPWWSRFCSCMEREEWINDARFADMSARLEHRVEMMTALNEIFLRRTAQEWLDRCTQFDLLCAPVLEYDEVFQSPPVTERDLVVSMDQKGAKPVKVLGSPIRLSETPWQVRAAPPGLGQDTDGILNGLGYTADDVKRLRENGSVA